MVNGYVAGSLKEALEIRAREAVTPYGGGTDLMVEADENANYLFLHKVPEMREIAVDNEYIRIGASCTFTQIAENPLAPAILRDAVLQIAAPAIRNLGTIGGNIGNGSAKADSALILFVTDAKLRLASAKAERIIPVAEFYLGRKKLALMPDELIVEILIPKTGLENYYYKKVGARKALAISRLSFAGIMDIKDGKIMRCATAFGAITDVILRRPDIDALLEGKTPDEARELKQEYLLRWDEAIMPIRGRISAEYRKDVAMNLLRDFLDTTMGV